MTNLLLHVIIQSQLNKYTYNWRQEMISLPESPELGKKLTRRIIHSLAKMECPNFSEFDSSEEAMWALLYERDGLWEDPRNDEDYYREKWYQSLQEGIFKISEGKIKLIPTDSKDFSVVIKDYSARYFFLTGENIVKKVIISVGKEPVLFVD